MRLNPNCIRDILLVIEDITDYETSFHYCKDTNVPAKLQKYTHQEIIYHIIQCQKSDLIECNDPSDCGSYISITDLNPKGHEFLANIRTDTIWNSVLTISKKVGVNSLTALTSISSGVVVELIKQTLLLN